MIPWGQNNNAIDTAVILIVRSRFDTWCTHSFLNREKPRNRSFATCKSIFKYIFTDVVGMTKECLELIYSEVKEKSQREGDVSRSEA